MKCEWFFTGYVMIWGIKVPQKTEVGTLKNSTIDCACYFPATFPDFDSVLYELY